MVQEGLDQNRSGPPLGQQSGELHMHGVEIILRITKKEAGAWGSKIRKIFLECSGKKEG